jgi:hypothetical protein
MFMHSHREMTPSSGSFRDESLDEPYECHAEERSDVGIQPFDVADREPVERLDHHARVAGLVMTNKWLLAGECGAARSLLKMSERKIEASHRRMNAPRCRVSRKTRGSGWSRDAVQADGLDPAFA